MVDPRKKKKTCFTAVHKNPNVPIVTNWCRISQPSTISCHLKSWLLPLDVVPKKSDTLLQEMQPTKHPGVTSSKRTWWLCIEYGKPWHFDAFWATLCTLKSHKNIPIILWHLPTGPTPIRCTRHLPHCCPARVQLLWHFNEKHTLLKIQKKDPKPIGVSYAVLFKWPFWAIQMNKCRSFMNKNAFFGLEWLKQMKVHKYYKLQTCTDAHRNIR